jgi:hypothetical protein
VLFESYTAHGPPGKSLLYKDNDCGAQEVSLCHGHTGLSSPVSPLKERLIVNPTEWNL